MSTYYKIKTNGYENSILDWMTLPGPKLKRGTFSYKIKIIQNTLSLKKPNTVSMMIGIFKYNKDTDLYQDLEANTGIAFSSGVGHFETYFEKCEIDLIQSNECLKKYNFEENSVLNMYGEYLNDSISLGLIIDDKDLGIILKVNPNEIDENGEDIYVGFSAGYYSISTIFELYDELNIKKMLNLKKKLDIQMYFE